MRTRFVLPFLALWLSAATLLAQQPETGNLTGSFQSDVQLYFADSVINANAVDERIMSNSFLQLGYQRGHFSAGMRYEAYLNPLLGFRGEYKGQGIPYRWAAYTTDAFAVTVGNIYDQFGTGMVFRAYQEWSLGIDNSVDGVHMRLSPVNGLTIKGIIGRQRKFWNQSAGLLRGGDAELALHQLLPSLAEKDIQINFGGSIMSRFLEDDDVVLRLPENVSAFAGRFALGKGGFTLNGEYAYKINDPFTKNRFNYNAGNGIYLNLGYTKQGIGFTASVKRIDNLDFRSERAPRIEELTINFLPPTTLQHTYRLSTLYPYATQPNGEFGFQADLVYTFKKGTALGGKYGTQVYLNYARIHGLRKTYTDSIFRYETPFWWNKEKMYFQDFNMEINKKWSAKFKSTFKWINLYYDKGVIELGDETSALEPVRSNLIVADLRWKLAKKSNFRTEWQWMGTAQDLGSWIMGLAEYSISPHWYFTLWDEWNYGNPVESKRAHYYNGNVAYVWGPNRLSLGYGRQRPGLLCVGGICRVVPAANGFTFSVASTF